MPRAPSLLIATLIACLFLAACAGPQGEAGPVGPAGAAGPVGPPGPAGENATASQSYVGSERCGECHEDLYSTFILSGHPYKLTKIENGQSPTFPYDAMTGGVTQPPEGYTWDDITYVIGGFGWKARFIGTDGYIITGDETAVTQYNFANEAVGAPAGWVAYHAGEQKPYDCGACHTTGYAPQGHQDNLEGIVGTWEFPGIQCEACHGPGSRHAEDPRGVRMVVERASQLCGECHIRGNPAQIDAENGFAKHHEQFEDLYNSRHFALACIDCHDPHASSVFADEELNPTAGIRQQCETCHWQQEAVQNNRLHLGVECVDCHMPPMAFSAQGDLDIFTADVRSHQFSINPNPEAPQFNEDGTLVMPYITLQYACGHCHNGKVGSEQSLEDLAAMANGYHTPLAPTPVPTPEPEATPEASDSG